jgi:hypothetical protein
MKALIYSLVGLAAAVAMVLAAPVRAQTANDVNRLNAAIQVCNSGLGNTPECARLRSQLGGGGGGGGGTASALAGILGGAMAPKPAPPSAAPAAPGIGIDINKAITNCVARAAGDQAQIQRCLAIANGGAAPRP